MVWAFVARPRGKAYLCTLRMSVTVSCSGCGNEVRLMDNLVDWFVQTQLLHGLKRQEMKTKVFQEGDWVSLDNTIIILELLKAERLKSIIFLLQLVL